VVQAAPEFPVLDVADWQLVSFEPAGSDQKVWLTSDSSSRALFKPNRGHQHSEQGEDWAEKLVAEIAKLIGIPAAEIDLAKRSGIRGCVSYNVSPVTFELQPGATLIGELVGADFDPRDRHAHGHTLANIATALAAYGVPPGFAGPSEISGFGVFAGYLVLDALVANRDRHCENWAVLRTTDRSPDKLAPSYDHASSLGFNLQDDRRERLLHDTRTFETFLRKGDAYRFEDGQRTTLVDYAIRALAMAGDLTRTFWLDRLAGLDPTELPLLTARIPTMSDRARSLAVELLIANRRRLLDG
jgi:hypothetical protein